MGSERKRRGGKERREGKGRKMKEDKAREGRKGEAKTELLCARKTERKLSQREREVEVLVVLLESLQLFPRVFSCLFVHFSIIPNEYAEDVLF